MDLVIEKELAASPTNIAELELLIEENTKQGKILSALEALAKILTIQEHSLNHLHLMRQLLYIEPANVQYSPYYLIVLNYKIFDHKVLLPKIIEVVFQLEKNITPQNNPILHAILRVVAISDANLENLLCKERQENLRLLLNNQLEAINIELLKAITHQCYLNEHVWNQDAFATQQVINLLTTANNFIANTQSLDYKNKCAILLAACYFSLSEIIAFFPSIESGCLVENDLLALYILEVANFKEEEQLKATIPALTKIDQAISSQVRAQYEQYPYPRWACVELSGNMSFTNFIGSLSSGNSQLLVNFDKLNVDNPQILIAGSGTGSQPLQICQIINSEILALDLSLSSLAYSIRQTNALGIKNITYAQGDLTRVDQLQRSFDYIECIGVLHHTRNIESSLRKLCNVLKPGGLMRIGLYSAIARAELKFIKQFVKENYYTPDIHGVRKLRQDIKERLHLKEFTWAVYFSDFFTTSMCIDLLFHTHELVTSIPEIKQMLRKNNLEFIGFDFPYYSTYKTTYKETFPDDPLMINLNNWHKFEQLHPKIFASMYCFLVQKINS